jgi:hypothetical protein
VIPERDHRPDWINAVPAARAANINVIEAIGYE